jgi:hypothetical protein
MPPTIQNVILIEKPRIGSWGVTKSVGLVKFMRKRADAVARSIAPADILKRSVGMICGRIFNGLSGTK